jgi:hypothetical protein
VAGIGYGDCSVGVYAENDARVNPPAELAIARRFKAARMVRGTRAVRELLVVSCPPDRRRRYMGQMYLFQELA